MNSGVKKTIFFTIFVNIFLAAFASGIPDREQQSFGSVQLKIVNLTNNTIYFYFNRLYIPWEIKSHEEYITRNTLVTHSGIPLGTEVPGFIGIQYNRNEDIIVYRLRHRNGEHIFSGYEQYVIAVKDSSIDFIEGNIDDMYDYSNNSIYNQESNRNYWNRVEFGKNIFELKMENKSGSNKSVSIYTVYEPTSMRIEDGKSEIYTIDDEFFSLGGIRLQVSENGHTLHHILLLNWHRNGGYNIKLQLNEKGYAIDYY